MTQGERKQATTKRAKQRIPHFETVEQAAEFWDTHSTTEFEDAFEPVPDVRFVVTRGEPKKALTVRLPQATVDALTKQAHAQGIKPSTLVRLWVVERLQRGRRQA